MNLTTIPPQSLEKETLQKHKVCVIKSRFANLYSVQNALQWIGVEAIISDSDEEISQSDILILPGVGSFAQVVEELESKNLIQIIKKNIDLGKPFLGICLGMQLLFERGYEGNKISQGLGILQGEVIPIPADIGARIPHIGWNSLKFESVEMQKELLNPLEESSQAEAQVYFVHSFYCSAHNSSNVIANVEIVPGWKAPAIVGKSNCFGMQFHPERSGKIGLRLLENFLRIATKLQGKPRLD